MNFLQLSVELAKLADISGQPASVDNVRGEHKRVVDWVNQAWREIQSANDQWSFMWSQATPIMLASGTSLYDQPVDCRDIITATVSLTDVVGNTSYPEFVKFEDFRTLARNNAANGRPQYWTVRPDNKIIFYPAPDSVYQLDFEYYKKPADLVFSTDTPSLPEHFHMAIVYLGLFHYGVFEEAPSVMQMARANYNSYLLQMSNECLPMLRLNGALV